MDPVMVAVDETLRYIQAMQYQQFQEQYYYDYYYETVELHQAALDPDKITDWLPGEKELYNTITTSIKEQLTTAADHVGKASTDALEKTRFWEKVTPELDKVLYKYASTMEEHIEDIYKAGKKQGFDKLQVKSFFGAADKQALFTLKNYNFDLVKNLSDDLRTQIRREVWTGVARGDTIRAITNRIKALDLEPIQAGKRLITPEQRAHLIARTETMRAVNQGQLLAFQQYGIEYIEIIKIGDARVCPKCAAIEGKIYPIKSATRPDLPLHPLCRHTYGAADKPLDKPVDISFGDVVSLVPGFENSLTSAIEIAKRDGVKLDGVGLFSTKEDQAYATINMLHRYRANSKLTNIMIEEYQSHLELFKLLNQALYKGTKLTAELKKVRDGIDAGMVNAVLKESLIVFRAEYEGLNELFRISNIGDKLDLKAFTSTSMSPDRILAKKGWKSIVLVEKGVSAIHIPSINKITGNSNIFTKQRELLINRGVKGEIIWKDNSKRIVIYRVFNKG